MWACWLAVFAAVIGLGAADAVPTGWRLVWADEFDGPGSAPDGSKWTVETGGNGWGNNELQTYTARTNNVRVEAGHLVIEARRETLAGEDGRSREFTSARLKTLGHAEWTHGRIEARMQLPCGQGIWPAFWMLGSNPKAVGWPRCGEIDIMEHIGREPGTIHGTLHGPGYSAAKGIGKPFVLPNGKAFADGFHVFAVDWDAERIRWFVDGSAYHEVTPERLPSGKPWVFDAPQFVLLNLAVGGHWPGVPDGTTEFPQRLLVDYVRVYAREPKS